MTADGDADSVLRNVPSGSESSEAASADALAYASANASANASAEAFSEALKALCDPTRLKLLKLLCVQRQTEKHTVSQLGEKLGIAQPNVSHHVKILKTAGFLRCEKRGSRAYYVADKKRFDEVAGFLSSLFDEE